MPKIQKMFVYCQDKRDETLLCLHLDLHAFGCSVKIVWDLPVICSNIFLIFMNMCLVLKIAHARRGNGSAALICAMGPVQCTVTDITSRSTEKDTLSTETANTLSSG